ncbi:MAG: DUF1844 domain-containing protein [Candidatus Bathyarchaeota archaeon]
MSEEEREEGEPQQLDLTALELDQLLGLFMGIFSAKAWQYMGIRMTPGKEEAEKDMSKAAKAIDCVSFMVDKLAPSLPEQELVNLRSMVSDLQINYARQSKG